jgi:hypothetical protein
MLVGIYYSAISVSEHAIILQNYTTDNSKIHHQGIRIAWWYWAVLYGTGIRKESVKNNNETYRPIYDNPMVTSLYAGR